MWDHCAPQLLTARADGVPGRGGVSAGVGCLRWSGGGAPVPLCLQHVSGFFVVPFWQWRQPDMWFWRSIAGCLFIATFTFLCPGNSTPSFCSPGTSAWGFMIRYFLCSIAVRKKPSLAILAIFKAWRMLDGSICTLPPCVAIVAGMWKTYKKLVAAVNNEIRLLALP